ncbi:RHOMBOID-like protein 10, chloroplastic [Senna tora]|uniref:RHOMBOID-like protein 10, chloroplastic n=1 Tax=Senna tora TaxID=362788 RepID=A0A834SQG9_9FABA|nr:RHOMBOID-like protein 10, chloroplastic [Senna tora]
MQKATGGMRRYLMPCSMRLHANTLGAYCIPPNREQEGDKWIWENDRSGIYTVKSGYKSAMLETWSQFDFSLDINAKATSRFWKRVWKLPILSRLFIAQLATQGKLLLWGAKINILIDKGQIVETCHFYLFACAPYGLVWILFSEIAKVEYYYYIDCLMEIEKDIISITTTCPKMLEEQEFDISVADQ